MGAERKTLRGQSGVRKCSGYRFSAAFWVIFPFCLGILRAVRWFFKIRGIPRRPGFTCHTSVLYFSVFLNTFPYFLIFQNVSLPALTSCWFRFFFFYNLRIFSNISHLFNHQGFYQTITCFFFNQLHLKISTPNFSLFLTGLFLYYFSS